MGWLKQIRTRITPDAAALTSAHWTTQLSWLIQLRWWALTICLVAWALIPYVQWPFFDESKFIAGVALGTVVNSVLWLRLLSQPTIGPRELGVHIVSDVLALTWLLAASGDTRNPFIVLYAVPVVLATLLLGESGTLLAFMAGCVGILVLSSFHTWLPLAQGGALDLLQLACVLCLMGALGFLALSITKRLKSYESEYIGLERLATLGRAMQGIAHELNTPLMTMQTVASDLTTVLDDVELDTLQKADILESLELFNREVARCGRLTGSLLKHNAASLHMSAQVDLAKLCEEAIAALGEKLGGDVRIVYHGDDHEIRLRTDRDRVQQILMNLIQNALLAARSAQNVESPSVLVRLSSKPGETWVDIIDNGPGIPEEVQARLFMPFITTRRSGEGTGLGLYTAQKLVSEMGGVIQVHTTGAEGTTIRVTLREDK